MAAWSMTRWQSSGQSCISPSMARFPWLLSLRLGYRSGAEAQPGPGSPDGAIARRRTRNASSGIREKSCETEPRDVVGGGALCGEVGEDLSDHRRELEAVAGAGRRDDDVGRAGQPV